MSAIESSVPRVCGVSGCESRDILQERGEDGPGMWEDMSSRKWWYSGGAVKVEAEEGHKPADFSTSYE